MTIKSTAVIDCFKNCVKQQHVNSLTNNLAVLARGWNRTELDDRIS